MQWQLEGETEELGENHLQYNYIHLLLILISWTLRNLSLLKKKRRSRDCPPSSPCSDESLFSWAQSIGLVPLCGLYSRRRSRRHVTTDGRSVSQYVEVSSPLWDLRPDITFCPKVVFWKVLSCLCAAPSLTRGRVCRNRSGSYFMTDSQSVNMSRYRAHSGTCNQILLSVRRLFSERCYLVSVRRPLWQELGSVEIEVEVTLWLTVSQSVSQYVLVSSTLVGLATRYYFLSGCCSLKFAVLYLWGVLSDERTGLQFAVYFSITNITWTISGR
jgi:hypothetical protein